MATSTTTTKNTYRITLPTGKVIEKHSAREVRYAVIVREIPEGGHHGDENGEWVIDRLSGSRKAAEDHAYHLRLNSWNYGIDEVEFVPVENVERVAAETARKNYHAAHSAALGRAGIAAVTPELIADLQAALDELAKSVR